MGILAKVGTWIATNLPTIVNTVKKVATFAKSAAELVEAHMEGKVILEDDDGKSKKRRTPSQHTERPNFMNGEKETKTHELQAINERLEESKKKLSIIEESNDFDHRRIALQIDVMELIVCSQTFERFSNNINIHAANLKIHLQTIKNTAGLLDQMNRQNKAIKALMKTVNHLINVTHASETVEKIAGIDVAPREGAISIIDAYRAFEETRDLLVDELQAFTGAIDTQLNRVERVRATAKKIPNLSAQVAAWLEKSVEPSLKNSQQEAISLRVELDMIPRIEAELRRELLTIEKTDGEL